MSYNSLFGFLALAIYVFTLIPSNIGKIFPHTRKSQISRFLLKKRRLLGLIVFSLSIDHALITVVKYDMDLFDLKTYIAYYTGISVLIIFTILAVTSNNWSIRTLRRKWKMLHQLTYAAMFLLLWHIMSKMSDSWTFFTPIALYLISFACLVYLSRLAIEFIRAIQRKFVTVTVKTPQILSEQINTKQLNREEIEIS